MRTKAISQNNNNLFIQHNICWRVKQLLLAIAATICTLATGFLCGNWLSKLWKEGLTGREIVPLPISIGIPLQISGNAPLSDAQVICFPEDHTDSAYQQETDKIIRHYYREGDVVLTEGVRAGKIIKPSDYGINLPDSYNVQGCDDITWLNQDPALAPSVASYRTNCKKLKSLLKGMQQTIPDDPLFKSTDLPAIEKAFADFLQEYIPLSEYFLGKEHTNKEKIKKILDTIFNKFKERTFDNNKNSVLYLITRLLKKLEDELYNAKERHVKLEEVLPSITPRNKLLSEKLQQAVQPRLATGNRVFVRYGAQHFLRPPPPIPDCSQVRKTLAQYKWVYITSKDISQLL